MLFYRYKCKKCGKRYVELPSNCECGEELKFICPASYDQSEMKSKNCEEIFEPKFLFWIKNLNKKFEGKVNGIDALLKEKQAEIDRLREKNTELEAKIARKKLDIILLKRDNDILSLRISSLNEIINNQRGNQKPKISEDVKDAVFYAMKKSHPDNGGKEEDFIRFKKCYEELTK